MNDLANSPFVVGARVAISDGWDNWHEGFVEKVHKTGRFLLKGSDQQWRPHKPWSADGYWRADRTGDAWSRTSLRIWDERADAEIKEIFAKQARKKKRTQLVERLRQLRDDDLTDSMLAYIETALPAIKSTDT